MSAVEVSVAEDRTTDRSDAYAMVAALCAAADAHDADAFAKFFTESARFRFGNHPEIFGRAAIRDSTAGTVEAVGEVRHQIDQVAVIGRQLFCRFTILATAADASPLVLPCVTVIGLADGLIEDYQVHMDISPALK